MELIKDIREWEKCSENSVLFETVASHVNAEMESEIKHGALDDEEYVSDGSSEQESSESSDGSYESSFVDKDSDRLSTDDESDNSDMISDDNDELESEETCVREVADAARDAETDTDCAPHSQSDV